MAAEGQEPFKSGRVATHTPQRKTFGKSVYLQDLGSWGSHRGACATGQLVPAQGLKGFRQQVVRQ